MRLPFRIVSRVNENWREPCNAGRITGLETTIALKDRIIRLHVENEEAQRRHLATLEATITDGRAQNQRLIADAGALRIELFNLRQTHTGDLQLERTRYDEFVRDVMEKVVAPAHATPLAPRSSSHGQQLPSDVQEAIDEVAHSDEILARHLENEAWTRLKKDVKPEVVAKLIREGESPEL